MKRDIEGPIHKAILRLGRFKFPGAYIHHSPNERKSAVEQRKAAELGTVKGHPDIEILWRGVFMAVEVKAPNGRLTDAQIEAGRRIVENGGRWAVARSVSEAEAIFDAWKAEIVGLAEIPHRGSIG